MILFWHMRNWEPHALVGCARQDGTWYCVDIDAAVQLVDRI
jgi:hypothetical protein